jgi:FAD/FMN-containing dehydrogenase
VLADEEQNAELLWAARGAGPGFPGVVTRFQLAVRPLPRAITSSTYLYALSELEPVAEWASDVVNSLPPTVELTLLLAPAPPDVESGSDGRLLIVAATAFEDSAEEAAAALAPLEGSPVLDRALARQINEPTPFDVLFRDFGGLWREGHRFASDNVWADADFADILPRLRAHLGGAPSPESFAFAVVAPAPAEDAPEQKLPDMAFSMVGRAFVSCYAMWEDEADDAPNLRWLPSLMGELEPLAIGHYLAETDLTAAHSRAERSFARPNWDRLQELRRDVDPEGVFASYLTPDSADYAAARGSSSAVRAAGS